MDTFHVIELDEVVELLVHMILSEEVAQPAHVGVFGTSALVIGVVQYR